MGQFHIIKWIYLAGCTSVHTMLKISCSNERNFELTKHNVTKFWDLETIGIKENVSLSYDSFKISIQIIYENR